MRLDSSWFWRDPWFVVMRFLVPAGDLAGRVRGAVAGLIVPVVVGVLTVFGGTTATPNEVVVSIVLVALLAMTAGWLAGPLVAGRQRRLLVAALGYAIALILATACLSLVQAGADSLAAHGPDPLALTTSVAGPAVAAAAGTAYLIVPAVVLGLAWSALARGLDRARRTRIA